MRQGMCRIVKAFEQGSARVQGKKSLGGVYAEQKWLSLCTVLHLSTGSLIYSLVESHRDVQ